MLYTPKGMYLPLNASLDLGWRNSSYVNWVMTPLVVGLDHCNCHLQLSWVGVRTALCCKCKKPN